VFSKFNLTKDEALKIGGDLLVKSNLWGAWIFNNPEVVDQNNVSRLPDILSYKIRMNSSLTHNTIYTQDKVYYYGNTFKPNKLCKKLRLTFEFVYSKRPFGLSWMQ